MGQIGQSESILKTAIQQLEYTTPFLPVNITETPLIVSQFDSLRRPAPFMIEAQLI
jgi:hypothetical protein